MSRVWRCLGRLVDAVIARAWPLNSIIIGAIERDHAEEE